MKEERKLDCQLCASPTRSQGEVMVLFSSWSKPRKPGRLNVMREEPQSRSLE